jgi:hypothetical protein
LALYSLKMTNKFFGDGEVQLILSSILTYYYVLLF